MYYMATIATKPINASLKTGRADVMYHIIWYGQVGKKIHGHSVRCFNPLRAELLWPNIKMYFHPVSFPNTDMTRVIEVLTNERQ